MEVALSVMTTEAGLARPAPAATVGFEALYTTECGRMVRLARGLVDTTERAEEIVQDAFAKVFHRWDKLDTPGGYLRTAVVNGARSELRKREVRRRIGLDIQELSNDNLGRELGRAIGNAVDEDVDSGRARPTIVSIVERAEAKAKVRQTRRVIGSVAASMALFAGVVAGWSVLNSETESGLVAT